ncbi:hypothetical protein DVA86_32825 [Streptomyces armeniacus]|uniref:PPM-type phosphatase domain-containing protein n=1 Tax=Streptomyces armeniacus TaxID=83291 RepID=A0A345XYC7_9ACTN|nr:protein phosphatase 2C domain-containing protein [Streptomyces armeniacus]AXK36643.1 hypothetical protein DVA86_32825 [Streptomyces armeniacus]
MDQNTDTGAYGAPYAPRGGRDPYADGGADAADPYADADSYGSAEPYGSTGPYAAPDPAPYGDGSTGPHADADPYGSADPDPAPYGDAGTGAGRDPYGGASAPGRHVPRWAREDTSPPEKPRGAPRHVGARPPRYAPTPLGLPAPRDGDAHAAILPDTVLDGARYGPLTVRAVSVRGDSHRHLGECRQDALALTRLGSAESGLLLLAVADGVGGASRSHSGSNGIVHGLAQLLDRMAEPLLEAIAGGDADTFQNLADEAVADAADMLRANMKAPAQEYSTTLRALLVPLDPAVQTRGFLSVGDGGLFRITTGGWQLLDGATDPDGEGRGVINTSTPALPDNYDRVATSLLAPSTPGDVLVLCTDGFSGPLEGERELRALLADDWGGGADVPHLSDFLWQVQTRAKTYDDDRTVICLWEGVR